MAIRFFRDGETLATAECYAGLNILAHAQFEELRIGSRCGGHGVCGGDRVRIEGIERSDLSPPTEIERRHLGDRAISEGWRLGCQCFPARDGLDLEVEVLVPKAT